MANKEIDLMDGLDYVSLDKAIAYLKALRKEHGGASLIDIGLDREPYECSDHAYIKLIVKE